MSARRDVRVIAGAIVLPMAAVAALLAAGAAAAPEIPGRAVLADSNFRLEMNRAGITSLRQAGDAGGPEYIEPGRTLGHVRARYRRLENPWQEFDTEALTRDWTVKQGSEDGLPQHLVVYNGSGWYDYDADLELTERFRLEDGALYWTIHFRNLTHRPIEVTDLVLPLPWASDGLEARVVLTEHDSYIIVGPTGQTGQSLVMTPLAKAPYFEPPQTERNFTPARLESADGHGVYIHSLSAGQPGTGGAERPPDARTWLKLTPKFTPGDEVTYGFKMQWLDRTMSTYPRLSGTCPRLPGARE